MHRAPLGSVSIVFGLASVALAAALLFFGQASRPAFADPPGSSVYSGGPSGPHLPTPSPIPCGGGENIALIQDVVPWAAAAGQDPLGANVTELKSQGRKFCIITSDKVAATDLSGFKDIIMAGAQTQEFYDNLFPGGVIQSKISSWVQFGGVLSANLADQASGPGSGGNWTGKIFVGGLTHTTSFSDSNSIAAVGHPIIVDSLPCGPAGHCAPMVDAATFVDIDGWSSSSHGVFGSLPAGSTTILTCSCPGPVLIEYPFGNGRVIASMTTTEFRYVGGFGTLPQNKKLLSNEIAYQASFIPETGGPDIGGALGAVGVSAGEAARRNRDRAAALVAANPPITVPSTGTGITITAPATGDGGLKAAAPAAAASPFVYGGIALLSSIALGLALKRRRV